MNFLGKLFGWMLVVCLCVAFWLNGRLLAKRRAWLDKIAAKQKQLDDLQSGPNSVGVARRQFEVVRNDLDWENDNWGKAWVAPNSGASPAGDGGVELGVGSNAGLGGGQQDPAKMPVVYLFGTGTENKPVYLGDFQLLEIRQDTAGGKLTRTPAPGEIQTWPRGEFRVREDIPVNYRSELAKLRTDALIADQHVKQEETQLKIQDQHIEASQKALDKRLAELNGNPEAPEKAGQDVKDGLVQTIRREEVARNVVVKEVDTLRRSLSDKHLALTKLLEQIVASKEKLSAAAMTSKVNSK